MDYQKAILKMIKRGTEERPIRYSVLEQTFDLSRRDVRRIIANLKQKHPICNYQDGRGYFMGKTKAQAQRQLKQERSRANKIYEGLKGLTKLLKKA